MAMPEENSAVSPYSQAALGQFASMDPTALQSRLGFAGLAQQREAQQAEQQDRALDRSERRADRQSQMEQFTQSIGLQKQGLDLQRQSQQQEQQRFQMGLEHSERMAEESDKRARNLWMEQQTLADQRKMLELEFAASTGEEREAAARKLLDVKNRASDIDAKLTTIKLTEGRSRDEIRRIREKALETIQGIEEMKKTGRETGATAADFAKNEYYQSLAEDSAKGKKQAKALFSGGWGSVFGTPVDDMKIEDSIGFGFLKANQKLLDRANAVPLADVAQLAAAGEVGFDQVMPTLRAIGDAFGVHDTSSYLDIDESKIDGHVKTRIADVMARSISRATNDKVNVDQLRTALNDVMQDGKASPMEVAAKLNPLGVSLDAVTYAMKNVANSFEGIDNAPLSVNNLMAKKRQILDANQGEETIQTKALDAAIMYAKKVATTARMLGTKIPETEVDGIRKSISYIDRVLGGNQAFDVAEMQGLVGDIGGTSLDDEYRSAMASAQMRELEAYGRSKRAPRDVQGPYGPQEPIGPTSDVFGEMAREMRGYEGLLPGLTKEQNQYQLEMENAASSSAATRKMIKDYMALLSGRRNP